MSLCSNTLRALSRTRISKPNTLLPFLYQTATIQQWKSTTRPIARRSVSSRPTREDDIPFEVAEDDLPPAIDDVKSSRQTTMTMTERAAFEKLYKTFNTKGQGRSKDGSEEHEELDQIADEYYEDDEDGSSASLDKAFDAVLQGSLPGRHIQSGSVPMRNNVQAPQTHVLDAQPLEPETLRGKKRKEAIAERKLMKKLREDERRRVDTLLKSAQTDRELWQILEKEVFGHFRQLNLDNLPVRKAKSTVSKRKIQPKSTTVDTRILFPNYPNHLITALVTLRNQFPTSPLPLTILPTMKSLGRSSYALGATAQLYKHLLRTAWIQHSSYALVDTLLSDMDSNVVEFDAEILEVLDAMIQEHEMARSSKLGPEIKMVYEMDQWVEGINKIREWRQIVAERIGFSTLDVPMP